MGVLTVPPPLLAGKAGIANGSSLNDVTEMDCSSSAIDELIKEVRPHLGCSWSAWLELPAPNSACKAALLCLQLVQLSQHQGTVLMLAPAFLGPSLGMDLLQLCVPPCPSHTWLLPLSSS